MVATPRAFVEDDSARNLLDLPTELLARFLVIGHQMEDIACGSEIVHAAAATCRQLRDIAEATSSLWTEVLLEDKDPDFHMTKRHLSLSKNQCLTLYLDIQSDGFDAEDDASMFVPILDLLIPHSHRIGMIFLRTNEPDLPEFILSHLPSYLPQLSCLHVLQASDPEDDVDEGVMSKFIKDDLRAPALKQVRISFPTSSIVTSPFASARSLTKLKMHLNFLTPTLSITSTKLNDLISTLGELVDLQTLCLEGSFHKFNYSANSSSLIRSLMPSLEVLSLWRLRDALQAELFGALLRSPKLHTLYLGLPTTEHVIAGHLHSLERPPALLTTSFDNVLVLHLTHMWVESESPRHCARSETTMTNTLGGLLRTMPKVELLTVEEGPIPHAVWLGDDLALPKLKRLRWSTHELEDNAYETYGRRSIWADPLQFLAHLPRRGCPVLERFDLHTDFLKKVEIQWARQSVTKFKYKLREGTQL